MLNAKAVKIGLCMVLLAALAWPGADAWSAAVAGHVVFSRGACAASLEGAGNAPRLLGGNAEVYEGDVIQTGNDSFVVVEFADKARITIRPNSHFRVEKYATSGKAELYLEKGGVRATPGEIAKANPNKFQLQTPFAAVKTQGAEFSARLCEQDCTEENAAAKPTTAAPPPVDERAVGRMVQQQGKIIALDAKGNERVLTLGAPVYEGEHIRSQADSYGVVLLRDSGKLTLQPDSEIEISVYQYKPGDTDHSQSVIRVLTGGFRALTGAIGKEKKENVKYITPVATIGIRGTGFDGFLQQSPEPNGTPTPPAGADSAAGFNDGPPANGLYSNTWQGEIELCNDAKDANCITQGEGQSSFTASADVSPQFISTMPEQMQQGVRPDAVKVDPTNTPTGGGGSDASSGRSGASAPGLHVAVYGENGSVAVDTGDSSTTIGPNQSGFAGDSGPVVVDDGLPAFQANDPTPAPEADFMNFSPLTDQMPSTGTADSFQCGI